MSHADNSVLPGLDAQVLGKGASLLLGSGVQQHQNCALDLVIAGAVGRDAQVVPGATRVLEFFLFWEHIADHIQYRFFQASNVDLQLQVGDGPAHIQGRKTQ